MKFKSIKGIKVWHAIRRVIVTLGMLLGIAFLIRVAPNFEIDSLEKSDKLLINNSNVTKNLKNGIVFDGDNIFVTTDDVTRYLDNGLQIQSDKIITTSLTKTCAIYYNDVKDGKTKIEVNGISEYRDGIYKDINGTKYLSLSKLSDIYNYDISYESKNKSIIIDSTDKKYIEGTSSKSQFLRLKATFFSRLISKINQGEKFTIVQDDSGNPVELNGYYRIRTQKGNVGYIRKENISNIETIREPKSYKLADNKKASIVWDYYTPSGKAPSRTGKIKGVNVVSPSFYRINSNGSLLVNYTSESKDYIKWAHDNGYKVWPTLSNNGLNNMDVTSKLFSTFESRSALITQITQYAKEEDVDGINIDIERMYLTDKDNFSRFIIELAPRLHDIDLTLSTVVTAPDGSETWSLCYDRNKIGKATDYMVYMAYDEQGQREAHSICSYSIVENNIKKFLGQEGVPKDKLIVSMPFYTRQWQEKDGNVTSIVENMKDIQIPQGVSTVWDNQAKQNYMEWTSDGTTYKEWIEDKNSISSRLDLVKSYDLGGAGFWEKDRETSDVWDVIDNKLNN